MQPKTLSASSAQTYESCPARYKATHIDRPPDMSGSAASLGSACHEALEHYVKDGHYKTPDKKTLLDLYGTAYYNHFSTRDRFDEGAKMLGEWWERSDLLDGREVISTEVKETFDLPTSGGIIPFTYIWDRCDRLPDGSIEVVDYKSISQPIQPEDLKNKIQPRAYALAAAIKFPDAKEIWVSFDLLRYDVVGIKFTREDNIETWKYLKKLAERILADDGTQETLNPECRFCIRKAVCKTLSDHSAVGGHLKIGDLDEAINVRAKLEFARSAIETQVKDLDEFILAKAEEENVTEFTTDEIKMEIKAGSRRWVDSERAAKILGPDLMAKYGALGVKTVDELLKGDTLDANTKSELRQLIRKKWNAPSIKTTPIAPLGGTEGE